MGRDPPVDLLQQASDDLAGPRLDDLIESITDQLLESRLRGEVARGEIFEATLSQSTRGYYK